MTIALETCLDRNLALLERSSPEIAARVRAAPPRRDVRFAETDDGVPAVSIGGSGSASDAFSEGAGKFRALCSARRPLEEAERLISRVDLATTACIVVAGFGAGYHVAGLARGLKRTGLIIVFEPDVSLLRAVLERIDCSAWLGQTNIVFLTDPDDASAIAAATRGAEGLMAMGLELLEHPPSKQRLGPATARFYTNITSLMQAVRTTVLTTLVQVRATLRNVTQNVDHYVRRPGIADLAGAAATASGARPAIVVSAGPSLARNIDLLARPGVRERFVIIAVQTVLKPLLARGVRPHFITALDHHEISRRFYEGLTETDVEGVTLIAEPKANPAIFETFPGRVRLAQDRFLDSLLGPDLAGAPKGAIAAGATVAHLAYYVARHLGCDPVILTGQDLGFTDGQYYAAGAAIHEVWGGELNEFRSLEMMEWERIVRGRSHLRPMRDVLGRAIYTDEQMHNYLVQFERDFRADAERGLAVIDATEGGVAKRHTTAMPLAEALERFGGAGQAGVEELPRTPAAAAGAPSMRRVEERLRAVRRDVWKIGDLSRRTAGKLAQMGEHDKDLPRLNALIHQVHEIRDQVLALQPAYDLVQYLNQSGALNRMRSDRALHLAEDLSPLQRQQRQIERDRENVGRLIECADLLGAMLDEAASVAAGAPRRTRDLPGESTGPEAAAGGTTVGEGRAGLLRRAQGPDRGALAALIPLDFDQGALGGARDVESARFAGRGLLDLTLGRLARCTRVDRVIVLTDDAARARRIINGRGGSASIPVHVHEADLSDHRAWRRAMRPARLWAASCWRGGLGGATVFDELFDPLAVFRAMESLDLPAALLAGPDFCFLDPALCDEVVLRHLDHPRTHRLTFSQAAPGLAGCVVERSLAGNLARAAAAPGAWGAIGAVLAYNPAAPIPDLIASPVCAAASIAARDAGVRLVGDTPGATAILEALGDRAPDAELDEILAAARGCCVAPVHATVELCASAAPSGPHRDPSLLGEREPMSLERAREAFEAIAASGPGWLLTVFGSGDPLDHPDLGDIVAAARRAGVAGIHLRTDLACDASRLDQLLDLAPEVVSVDLLAHASRTHRDLTGRDTFEGQRANLEELLARRERRFAAAAAATGGDGRPREVAGGPRTPWIVPRLTRCDAVYEEIEPFYDFWLARTGCAVIDPLPAPRAGERIAPLPLPASAAGRRGGVTVLSDGTTLASPAASSQAQGGFG